MLAGSLLEEDWLDSVVKVCPAADLIVAEGVFYFFTKQQVRDVFRRLADAFPGASVVFDAQSPLFLWFSNFRQPIDRARLKFSLRDHRELEGWDPGFQVQRCIGFGDSPFYDGLVQRLAWYKRVLGWSHPLSRRLFQIIQLKLAAAREEPL
jgi:O-methyltransferase involved in polyketide biosynthesis